MPEDLWHHIIGGCNWTDEVVKQQTEEIMVARQQQVTLPDTEYHVISSTKVNQDFSIFVALPHSYVESGQAYPVDQQGAGRLTAIHGGLVGEVASEPVKIEHERGDE